MSRGANESHRGAGRGALWVIITVIVLAALLQFGPWPSPWLERLYLTVLYPVWSPMSSRVVDATPLSLSAAAAILLVLVPLLQLVLLRGRRWRAAGVTLGASLAALALLFPLTFGLAYRFQPLEQRLGLTAPLNDSERNTAEAWVLAQLQEAALTAPPTADQRWLVEPEAAAAASRCVARIAVGLGRPRPHVPARLKYLPAGTMLRLGFAGVVSPWLLEPHVDAGLTPSAALAVGLHEFAHSAGFAPEAEAEAVGLLAGIYCEHAAVRYASLLRLASDLAAAMPPRAARAYTATWPPRAVNDARAAAATTRRYHDERLAEVASGAYALYLQGQGGQEGLGEYQRGTELALRYLVERLDPYVAADQSVYVGISAHERAEQFGSVLAIALGEHLGGEVAAGDGVEDTFTLEAAECVRVEHLTPLVTVVAGGVTAREDVREAR